MYFNYLLKNISLLFIVFKYILATSNNGIHFAYKQNSARISENVRKGSSVGFYKIIEKGILGVTYSLKATKDERSQTMFYINKYTAEIKTSNSNLDREEMDKHYFKIIATYRQSWFHSNIIFRLEIIYQYNKCSLY